MSRSNHLLPHNAQATLWKTLFYSIQLNQEMLCLTRMQAKVEYANFVANGNLGPISTKRSMAFVALTVAAKPVSRKLNQRYTETKRKTS